MTGATKIKMPIHQSTRREMFFIRVSSLGICKNNPVIQTQINKGCLYKGGSRKKSGPGHLSSENHRDEGKRVPARKWGELAEAN